jgi:hypothetical protein
MVSARAFRAAGDVWKKLTRKILLLKVKQTPYSLNPSLDHTTLE